MPTNKNKKINPYFSINYNQTMATMFILNKLKNKYPCHSNSEINHFFNIL